MDDAIQSMYGEAFAPEELAELRRQVQYGEISFLLCIERNDDERYSLRTELESG